MEFAMSSTLWRTRSNVVKEFFKPTSQCFPLGFKPDPFPAPFLLLRMAEKGLDENLKGPLTEPSFFDCVYL